MGQIDSEDEEGQSEVADAQLDPSILVVLEPFAIVNSEEDCLRATIQIPPLRDLQRKDEFCLVNSLTIWI
ncbi:unnamed protein product [Didymodactylos carnosus]|uniref:Uncharacterized protein n=1 Tax=Didymodactylos carnosus TaxID=1234261 RepID=A0A8S2V145_9BILA|nr:unnamed protein product [Didymodactylos carnosus]CAF4371567.1 unnamed protein product [Didymodactylos carnosus]